MSTELGTYPNNGGGQVDTFEEYGKDEQDTGTKKQKILRLCFLKLYEIILIIVAFIIMAATYGITFINSLIIIAILIGFQLGYFILISIIYGSIKCCKCKILNLQNRVFTYFEFVLNSVCVWYSAQLISIFFICTVLIVSNHPYWTAKFEAIFLNPDENNGISFRPYFQANEYSATFLEPQNSSEIQDIILDYGIYQKRTIRAVGSGHSSADLSTNDVIISLNNFKNIKISDNNDNDYISVIAGAGISVQETEDYLYENGGYVLLGFGSAQFQRLGGMLGTGVYGAFGSMNKYLISVWIIDGNGNDLYITKGLNDTLLSAIKVNIGLLGVIYKVEFEIQKSFNVKKYIEQYIPSEFNSKTELEFDEIMKIDRNMSGNEYVGVKLFMWPWEQYMVETFENISLSEPATIINHERNEVGRSIINNILLPLSCFLPDCVEWSYEIELGGGGTSDDIYAAKSALRTDDIMWCSGMYAIPYENCQNMIIDLDKILNDWFPASATIIPLLQSDDYGYLSYGYDQDVCMVEFYPKMCDGNRLGARKIFETQILDKYNGTIHFAKRYLFIPEDITMKKFYSKLNDWKLIRTEMDPNNIFVNDYLGKYFEIDGFEDVDIKLTLLDQYNANAEGWTYAGWFAMFLSAFISIIMSFVVFRNDDYLSNLCVYNPSQVALNTKKSFLVLSGIIIAQIVILIIVFYSGKSSVS